VESSGGAFRVVISGVDIAIGAITVDGEDNRGGDGFGAPESLADHKGFTKRDSFGDAMDLNVDVDNLLLGGGPGAFDSGSSGGWVDDLTAGEILDIEGGIHLGVGGEGGENGDRRVERPGSNSRISSLNPHFIIRGGLESGSNSDGEFR